MAKAIAVSSWAGAKLRGKTVLLRVDVNSQVQKGRVVDNPRIAAAADSIKLLCKTGAKVVVLAHQGRFGKEDCISLKQHAALLKKRGAKIEFVPQSIGEKAGNAIKKLKNGRALVLENLRFNPEEEMKFDSQTKKELVKFLAPLSQAFVNDAFSVSHRNQESVVGFAAMLPCFAGPLFEKEVTAANAATHEARHPCVYLLGGNKPNDVVKIMEFVLEKKIADKICASGRLGELCLMARGNILSKPAVREYAKPEYAAAYAVIREMLSKHGMKVETPFDFAVERKKKREELTLTNLKDCEEPVKDIGWKTIRRFNKIIAEAKTVFVKGTCGVFEEENFRKGTSGVFKAVAASHAVKIIGGGHSTTALSQIGVSQSSFDYVSLSGGALLAVLSGEKLPGITALEQSAKKFKLKTK
ncbi:phosphoglycerate kinase [Candidatus Micrarchaeota archaeon]|nr:phosphoglycerate kinase [Candidatus Micrarchaeota archaeon]